MTRVLIITEDYVDTNMGGMGMRYWEIAHALAGSCQVTLAVPNQPDIQSGHIRLVTFDLQHGDIRWLAEQTDVIFTHGFVVHFHPYLREMGVPLVMDLFNPYLLENLVMYSEVEFEKWIPAYEEYLRVQLEMLRYGDFFTCATERQRDYWLGWLHAQKGLNPHTYHSDPSFRKLIDVLPSGLQEGTPRARQAVLKGVIPGIATGDRLILWSGGIWNWLDPLTPIHAMALLAPRYPDLKLYFMGTRHPNPVVPDMTMVDRAISLSKELGLYQKSVYFGSWVPYQERESYLAEADLAVLAHLGHIETHFSFRTRLLDCIWAGLPMVVTDGDAMADWVKEQNLGLVVPQGDPEAMARAIESVLLNDEHPGNAAAFAPVRDRLRWSKVIAPLLQFCQSPQRAPDTGLYLTETERISRGKDAYIEQIIHDKDAYIEQIIRDKDAHLNQVIHDWEAFLEQSSRDWQAHLDRVVQDREIVIQEKESALLSITSQLETTQHQLQDTQRQLMETQSQAELAQKQQQETQAAYTAAASQLEQAQSQIGLLNQKQQETQVAYDTALTQLHKYRDLFPFRAYRRLKRLFGRT
jgi:glycosyltransferase involved in cell wall biosynthesis